MAQRKKFLDIIEAPLIAPLAQLDRASGYEPEGREFESLRARHSSSSCSNLLEHFDHLFNQCYVADGTQLELSQELGC